MFDAIFWTDVALGIIYVSAIALVIWLAFRPALTGWWERRSVPAHTKRDADPAKDRRPKANDDVSIDAAYSKDTRSGRAPGNKGPLDSLPASERTYPLMRCPRCRSLDLVSTPSIVLWPGDFVVTCRSCWHSWHYPLIGSGQKTEDTPPPSVGTELGAQRGNPTPAISVSGAPEADGDGQRHQNASPLAGGETALGTRDSGLGMGNTDASGFTLDDTHEWLPQHVVLQTCMTRWLRGEACEHGPVPPYRYAPMSLGSLPAIGDPPIYDDDDVVWTSGSPDEPCPACGRTIREGLADERRLRRSAKEIRNAEYGHVAVNAVCLVCLMPIGHSVRAETARADAPGGQRGVFRTSPLDEIVVAKGKIEFNGEILDISPVHREITDDGDKS